MYITASGKTTDVEPNSFYVVDSDPPEWSFRTEYDKFSTAFSAIMDKIPEKYFATYDTYFNTIEVMPCWVLYTGISPESSLSRAEFEKFIAEVNDTQRETVFRIFYTEDTRDRLNFLQNNISDIKHFAILFYLHFSRIPDASPRWGDKKNRIAFVTGPRFDLPFSLLESIFQKMHTVLDLCVKLAYCIHFTPSDYRRYHKIKHQDALWNDRKKISGQFDFGPLESYKFIREIESLRNEFTHNGSWEACRRIYTKVKRGKVVDHWIYLHDHENGIPTKYVNRTRFYSDESNVSHVNETLPAMIQDFLRSVSEFLERIMEKIVFCQ